MARKKNRASQAVPRAPIPAARAKAPSRVAVIATVLNEGEHIRRLLSSLCEQTLAPDEVVIVDGGSRDHTADIARGYGDRLPIRVIVLAGCSISHGRNRAIAAATAPIIAVTDAGVELARDWLERLIEPMQADPRLDVVSGFFQADPQTIFEAALGATTLPIVSEIDAPAFLPSSRSIAFRRTAWARIDGYPEWIDYCEDLIFDLRLKKAGARFLFQPAAMVYFRPRESLGSFYKQYYRYARGDGKADLWRKRHAIRYATYLLAIPLIVALGVLIHPLLWLLLIVGGFVYLRTPYRRLRVVLAEAARVNAVRVTLLSNLAAIVYVPIVRVVGDVAKMLGYPAGWLWRLRHRPPNWRRVSQRLATADLPKVDLQALVKNKRATRHPDAVAK